jgi:hypothetical protein
MKKMSYSQGFSVLLGKKSLTEYNIVNAHQVCDELSRCEIDKAKTNGNLIYAEILSGSLNIVVLIIYSSRFSFPM